MYHLESTCIYSVLLETHFEKLLARSCENGLISVGFPFLVELVIQHYVDFPCGKLTLVVTGTEDNSSPKIHRNTITHVSCN